MTTQRNDPGRTELEAALAESHRQTALFAIHRFLDRVDERIRRIESLMKLEDDSKGESEGRSG